MTLTRTSNIHRWCTSPGPSLVSGWSLVPGWLLVFCWALLLASPNGLADNPAGNDKTLVVAVKAVSPQVEDGYYLRLLKMLLEVSRAPDEQIRYEFADRQFSQQRWMVEVSNEAGNGILWTVTTKARERQLLPLRHALTKGLIGLRLLIIRPADAATFASVSSIADLQKLVACQGSQWPDTQVLRANGLNVNEGMDVERLYKMLASGRCDYFPRGISELTLEDGYLQRHRLMAVPGLVITYPQAMYFFVNRNNHALVERLDAGWQKLVANGELDNFFFSQPRVQQALAFLAATPIRIIALDNPSAPNNLSIPGISYWLEQAAQRGYGRNTPAPRPDLAPGISGGDGRR